MIVRQENFGSAHAVSVIPDRTSARREGVRWHTGLEERPMVGHGTDLESAAKGFEPLLHADEPKASAHCRLDVETHAVV